MGDQFPSFCQHFVDEYDFDITSFIGFLGDDVASLARVDELTNELAIAIAESAQEADMAAGELGNQVAAGEGASHKEKQLTPT